MAMTTAHIVDEILAYDSDPPGADYSPYDFGVQVGSQLTSGVASDVVRTCFEALPSTTAESFIEGLLGVVAIESLDDLLLDSIARALEVGSGGAIVRLLMRFCSLTTDEIAQRIIAGVVDSQAAAEQDRLCFALWALVCGETYDVEQRLVRRNQGLRVADRIAKVIRTNTLSEYATSALAECLDRLAKA